MTPEQVALPHINPTVHELLERIARHRAGRREPTSMAMSPETWARIKEEARHLTGVTVVDFGEVGTEDEIGGTEPRIRAFNDIRVSLYDGCLGVGIAYTQT